MKKIKILSCLIIVAAVLTSCEDDSLKIQENSAIETNQLVYPPTIFPEGNIVNLSVKNLSGKVDNPCEIINGSFETGDFYGWNIETNGQPYMPWNVTSFGNGIRIPSSTLEGISYDESDAADGNYYATNGFDGGGPMTFVMYQDILVCPCAELTWQDRIWYDHGGEPRTFEVQLRNTENNAILETLYTYTTDPTSEYYDRRVNDLIAPPMPIEDDWQIHTFDISSYEGETVRLYFLETIPESFTGPAKIDFDAISLNTKDSDGDGVYDCEDAHPYSDLREEIRIDNCYPDVENILLENGSTMMDLINDLEEEINEQYDGENWDDLHSDFMRKLSRLTYYWRKDRLISRGERSDISSCGWRSNIPYLHYDE